MAINIAQLIAQQFTKNGKSLGVGPCTLTKSIPGTRTPGAISAGTNPTTKTFSATGLVTDFSAYERASNLVAEGARKVVLFGASIAGGAVPAPGDRVAIGGETLTIVKAGVDADPVKATYTCQCVR